MGNLYDNALWTKAKVRFETEVHYNFIDYGNSTRGCDAICANTVRDVYLIDFDSSAKLHLVDVGYFDITPVKPEEMSILELGETTNKHPVKIMMENRSTPKIPEPQKNLTELMKELQSAMPRWFPALMYSEFTKCWYVSALDIYARLQDETGDVTIGEHMPTPEKAVLATINQLKNSKYFYNTLESAHEKYKRYPVRFYHYNATKRVFEEITKPNGYVTVEDVIDTEFCNIEELVKRIEMRLNILPGILGTSIQRVMMNRNLVLNHHGLTVPSHIPQNKETYNVWCLGLGIIQEPKSFFYGFTIKEVLEKAMNAIVKYNGQPPTEADKNARNSLRTVGSV